MVSVVLCGRHLTIVSSLANWIGNKNKSYRVFFKKKKKRTCSSATLQNLKMLNLQSKMNIISVHARFYLALTLLRTLETLYGS